MKELTLPNTLGDTLRDCFYNNDYLRKVYCPPHITRMFGSFSYCGKLEEVVLPDSLKEISGAFYYCESLKKVELPKGLKKLGNTTFYNCSKMENIELPESLEKIGNEVFYGARMIKRLNIPNSVREIAKNAFAYSSIESINIPSSLEVKDFETSNFFTEMDHLNEIRYDENNKLFEYRDGALFYENNGVHELWAVENGVDVLRLPDYSKINIYYKAILNCLLEVIVPNSCSQFTYKGLDHGLWWEDSSKEYIKKLTIEEGIDSLALFLDANGETTISNICIRRPIVPVNKYMIKFSEQYIRTSTLCLNKNTSTIDLSKLYEPWSYYTGKPSMYTFHTYGPDVLEFHHNVVKIMPDFRLNFIKSGDLKSGSFSPNKIHTVRCYGSVPPECENLNGLTSIDADLYVPKGAWLAYVLHPFWKMFRSIQEMEYVSGVEETFADADSDGAVEVARYDVNGKLLTSPVQGLNIVKLSNGKVKKEFVK